MFKYIVIEGGPLGDKVIAFSLEIKFVAREGGGCVVTKTANYEMTPNAQIDEGRAKEVKENMNTLFYI